MTLVSGCGVGIVTGEDDGVNDADALSGGATYQLIRKGSGKCVDIVGGASSDGTGLQQWTCQGSANQQFRVENLGSGNVRLVNPATGKCVDIDGAGTTNRTRVQLWSCNDTVAQVFTPQAIGSYTRLRNPNSGKCVDVNGASNDSGVGLQLWTCNTSDAQLWSFNALSGGGGSGGGGGGGSGGGGGGDGLTWRNANLTNFESYPDPNSDECRNYNGCTWAGQFAFVDGKQSESWVMMHNIIAVHEKDANQFKLKTFRLRQGSLQIDATVYDECADSDCSGCCTANSRQTGFLIDIEKYTMQRFGSGDGIVEWACLDCK
jgi:hypothetical protein